MASPSVQSPVAPGLWAVELTLMVAPSGSEGDFDPAEFIFVGSPPLNAAERPNRDSVGVFREAHPSLSDELLLFLKLFPTVARRPNAISDEIVRQANNITSTLREPLWKRLLVMTFLHLVGKTCRWLLLVGAWP